MKRLPSRRRELDPRDVESALAELGLEQLLEREGLRYVFSSSAARDVVYGAMDEEERRQRHGVVAQGILQRPGAGGPGALEDIAHHLYHSENPASGREYLIRAGVRARRAGALREALLYFSRALEFLEGSADASLRFSILLSRESVLGLLGRKEAQKADIDRLKSLVEGMGGSPEELKRLAREAALREALYLESLGRKREALERLEATLASLTGDPGAEARLRARIAMLRLFLSDFEGGFRALEQALEQARQVSDGAVVAEILQL